MPRLLKSEVALLLHLCIVVDEADSRKDNQRQERDPDVEIAQVGPKQRGGDDRDHNQYAAHGGGAGLLLVTLGAFLADVLADLEFAQLANQQGPEDETQQKRCDAGESGPDSDVPEQGEMDHRRVEPVVKQVVKHLGGVLLRCECRERALHVNAPRAFEENSITRLRDFL